MSDLGDRLGRAMAERRGWRSGYPDNGRCNTWQEFLACTPVPSLTVSGDLNHNLGDALWCISTKGCPTKGCKG
jgi:hypothetical protein